MLSAAEDTFVSVLVETGHPSAASKASGLYPSVAFRSVSVQKAAREAMAARLLALAPHALSVLQSLMDDPEVPAAVRRLAASDILDRAGLVSQAALTLAKPLESLSEMPARDLRALVERLETELFSRAVPVRDLEFSAPNAVPEVAKPLSVLD